mgnify:CR=1 FL=1
MTYQRKVGTYYDHNRAHILARANAVYARKCLRRGAEKIASVPPEKRDAFWSKVLIGPLDSCWPWLGEKRKKGYGKYQGESAQRVAWEDAMKKRFPVGLLGTHSCDNPPCCNPLHVLPATHEENQAASARKGRRKGERSAHARLTRDQIGWARVEHARGQRVTDIARALGVTQPHVSNILAGRVWKDSS